MIQQPHSVREHTTSQEASSTASNLIYRVLREKIITLQLAPGSTMSEQETASSMGVSRTPVREAFIRLDKEKMIIISPQKRTTVAKIDLDRVAQEQFIREAMETAVLREFTRRYTQDVLLGSARRNHTEEALARMDNCEKQMEAADERQDVPQIRRWDDSFHQSLYESTDNALALQIIRRDCFEYMRLRSLSAFSREVQQQNQEQHRTILRCIRSGDADGAVAVLHEHLNRLFTEIDSMKLQWPDYFL